MNYRLNNQIKAKEVRVIDENGNHLGVMGLGDALKIAYQKNLDLIEVGPGANPPVVKIVSFDKFRYQKEKELKKQFLNQKKNEEFKQVRISPRMALNDLNVKARKVIKFLEKGDRVEIRIQAKGRENIHKEFILEKLNNFLELINVPYKIIMPAKKGQGGFIIQIAKNKK